MRAFRQIDRRYGGAYVNLDVVDPERWHAIATSGCTIELNTAGWHKPAGEAYPSPEFLELACSAGIPIVISTDAHSPAEVGRDMQRGIEVVKAAGYVETQLFAKHQTRSEPLT